MATFMTALVSELHSHARSDPEYFLPSHTQVEADLGAVPTLPLHILGQFACSAFYPAATHLYTSKGIPFLRCVDIVDFPLISPDQPFARIPADFVDAHSTIRNLKAGDIVISSKVGSQCYAALLAEDMPLSAMTRTVLGMSNIDESVVDPYYLIAFLRSRHGFDQLMRERELTIQYQLTLERTRKIKIFMPERQLQTMVGDMVRGYYKCLRDSLSAYARAQQLLEAELGLDKLTFQKPVGYVAQFSDMETSRRSDAQHYQPRFKQLIDHLSSYPAAWVREIRSLNRRGLQPIYLRNGTVDVVNSQHLGPKHIDYDGLEKISAKSFAAAPEAHIQQDDLLIYTTGAYIGRTNVCLSDAPAMASNHVNILRLRSGIDAAYMALVFQSAVGQFQTQQHARGSAQAELYPSDIDRFIVPLIDKDKQRAIGDLVRESLVKQQESKHLLEQAKTQVEQLIEAAVQP